MTTAIAKPESNHADNMSPDESIASIVIPYPFDDNRAKYLRLRACGLSSRESQKVLGITGSAISRWRFEHPEFVELEYKIPEYRKQLREEHLDNMFARNFCLVLEKDSKVLERSLIYINQEVDGKMQRIPLPLTKQEQEYLIKIRGMYTPREYEAIKVAIKSTGDNEFNWSDIAVALSRTDSRVGKVTAREVSMEFDNELPSLPESNGSGE